MLEKNNPILLPTAKSKFLNIVVLMTNKNNLFFEVLETAFDTDKIICFIDSSVAQITKKTIVILDNSPIHKPKKVIANRIIGILNIKKEELF